MTSFFGNMNIPNINNSFCQHVGDIVDAIGCWYPDFPDLRRGVWAKVVDGTSNIP